MDAALRPGQPEQISYHELRLLVARDGATEVGPDKWNEWVVGNGMWTDSITTCIVILTRIATNMGSIHLLGHHVAVGARPVEEAKSIGGRYHAKLKEAVASLDAALLGAQALVFGGNTSTLATGREVAKLFQQAPLHSISSLFSGASEQKHLTKAVYISASGKVYYALYESHRVCQQCGQALKKGFEALPDNWHQRVWFCPSCG